MSKVMIHDIKWDSDINFKEIQSNSYQEFQECRNGKKKKTG